MKLNAKALINQQKEKPQICLIENLLPANEVTLISAQKNSYKTFIGISLGLMYSTDEASKTGSETLEVMRTGGVMYLCLEGKAGFGNRVQSALSNDFYNDIGEWFFTDFDDETKNEFSHKLFTNISKKIFKNYLFQVNFRNILNFFNCLFCNRIIKIQLELL